MQENEEVEVKKSDFQKFSDEYDSNLALIEKLPIDKKTRRKAFWFSLLIAALVVIAPILVLCNLFVFDTLIYLIIFGIAVCIIIFLAISEIMHFKLLCIYCSEAKAIPYKKNIVFDIISNSVMCLIVYGVVCAVVGCLRWLQVF